MPNTSNDDVIIVGSLSDKELRESIDKLVDYVGDKTTIMAGKFDVAMEKMKSAMKDFAITQKVSVDLMQDAWKQMSASFDAMLKAQQNATSSGNNSGSGGGNSQYADNTVGHLQEIIALEEKRRKEMTLGSDALRDQNKLIEEQKAKLKGETTSDQVKAAQAAKKELQEAFTMPARGLADAEKKLQQLQSLSAKFQGRGILDQTQWNRLNAQIQTTQEKIDKLRQKKPTSIQDVLGMDESSVDAIAKKMAALKKVTVDPQNTAQVKQLGDEYQRLKRLQAELMGQNIQMTHSNNYLAQSFGYIRNRLVYAMTLGEITSFTKQVYEIRGQYELLERSLGVLVNSFERGSQIFQELNQMAIESPFTLMELAGAAKQLTAYNFAANEVVDTTRRLADISAALGVPMERLTYNLGQIRAQTVLTARDARDFANAGLPIVASLAEHFTELEGKIVTTGDVYDRMSKKMVSYSDVMTVLNKMTDEGGKFFEFQAKQAETLRVQMANLNLAWNNMLNDIGKSNQGLLTLPISGLKALLQNWSTLDRLIKSLVVSFGLLKIAQIATIKHTQGVTLALAASDVVGKKFLATIYSLKGAMKALATNPWTWVFVGIQAIVDLAHQFWNARREMHELNQEIRDNANEASESMLNYLNNKGNKSTLELAKQNKLTAEQGERAWESLKQQIEQSALSANGLIAELLAIEDVNERVRVGFDYAERIQKAQAALQDLKDDSIEVNTDVGWFGMFGEGLVSDLKDYADYIEKYSEIARKNQMAGEVAAEWMHQVGIVKGARQEFLEELDDTAESINNFIRAYNITDPLQINEILERVRSQIKAKNPEIKGEAAKIFDISLDQKMAELTNGAVDRNASLWNMFMERLKHNSSSAFQDINDDWIKSNEALSSEQQAAVDANLQYFKDSMPYAYQAVSEMVADASKLKIHIGIAFNVQQLSDFQKEVNRRIGNSVGALDFGGGAFLPTNNDNLSSWVKVQQQAIKSLGEENKKYALDDSQWSKEKIAANDREIQQRKNLLDLFHQQYAEKKKGRKGGNRKPEDVVAEALKQELQLIREMQSNYDKLRKSGVSNMDAIDLASKGYEATIIRINQVLSKFGIDKFNAANFAGKDVRSLLQSLEEQRKALLASGKVKTSSLIALDGVIKDLRIDVKTDDMKKVTDGLNSELGKIKDEYELAIELDANPELGGIFADMMGLNKEQLSQMPKDFDGVVERLQKIIDNKLGAGKFNLIKNLNKASFDAWLEANKQGKPTDDALAKSLESIIDYANKVRLDSSKKQIEEWNKLLEKYAEYEYKVTQIQKGAERERETARKKGASQEILDSINNWEKQELARVSFEEFQKYPEWIVATGDLANMSKSAIGMLIDELEKYKKTAKNLSPKQIKQLNQALSKLYKEQRKNNPFKAIANMLDEAKDRMATFDDAIADVEEQIQKAEDAVNDAYEAGEDASKPLAVLDKLKKKWKELKDNQEKTGKVDASSWVSSINETIGAVQSAIGVFNDLAKAIGGVNENDLDKVFSVIDKGGQGAAIGAQTGGGYGAIIGAVAGLATGLISVFAGAANERITAKVEESEHAVKRLENAYKQLEYAAENALGAATSGAQEAIKANKELQLAELKRQLALEQSRDSKDRDEDRIIEIRGQIIDLEHEIKDFTKNAVNDLLGISSHGDFFESMISEMIEAFKNGEDAMKVFEEKWSDMIDNMILKSIVSQVLSQWVKTLEHGADEILEKYTQESSKKMADRASHMTNLRTMDAGDVSEWIYDNDRETFNKILESLGVGKVGDMIWLERLNWFSNAWNTGLAQKIMDAYLAMLDNNMAGLQDELDKASLDATGELIDYYGEAGKEFKENYLGQILDKIQENWNFGQDSEKQLSNLQQGIQGLSEDTGSALESYINGVSQQVYLQSDLLTQIRDAVVGMDMDVQVATQAQMLLQLQQSYAVQMAIQGILEGWTNPSGQAVRVELVS